MQKYYYEIVAEIKQILMPPKIMQEILKIYIKDKNGDSNLYNAHDFYTTILSANEGIHSIELSKSMDYESNFEFAQKLHCYVQTYIDSVYEQARKLGGKVINRFPLDLQGWILTRKWF